MIEMEKLATLLSYLEKKGIRALDKQLGDEAEMSYVASRISDAQGITRSVLVGAQTKLEIAGLITTQSMGTKGTHIKIIEVAAWEKLIKIIG